MPGSLRDFQSGGGVYRQAAVRPPENCLEKPSPGFGKPLIYDSLPAFPGLSRKPV